MTATPPIQSGSTPDVPPQVRGYRLFCLGVMAVLTLMPVTMPVPVLRPLVLDRFQVGEFEASLFMAINMVGALLAAPLVGALADRFGRRRRIVLWALVADAALFQLLTWEVPFLVFLGVRLLEGMAHIAAISVLISIAADGAGKKRGRALGVVGSGLTLGVAAGAAVGGRIGNVDPILPLHLGSVVLLVGAVLGIFILPDPPLAQKSPRWTAALRKVLAHPPLRLPLGFAFVDRLTVGFFTTTFVLAMGRMHEMPKKEIGILLACFLGPFALLSYPFGRLAERRSPLALMAVGSVAYGVLVCSFALWSPELMVVWMVLLGLTSAVMFVPSMVITTQRTPAGGRSTAMGAFNAAGSLGFLIGPILGGAISEGVAIACDGDWGLGYTVAFLVAGTAELLCVAVLLFGVLRRREVSGSGG